MRSLVRGNVLWLGVVSLFTDLSSEMIYPLLPFFLTTTLGAGAAFLGLVEGLAEATASLLKLASGWFSDRAGKRKPLVLAGYGLASLARPLIALAAAPWHVLTIRFADRIGKGIRSSPRDALLADSVAAQVRGAAFGFQRAADHAGAVLGPLAASAILLLAPGQYRLVFALAAIPAWVSVVVLWRFVQERTVEHVATNAIRFEGLHGLPRSYRRFLIVIVIFTLGNATDAFLLLRAQQLGIAVAWIPALWAMLHVSKMAWSVPGGMLADRAGPRLAIASGWLIYAVIYAGFAFAASAWHVWLLLGAYGLYYGLTEAPEKALVAALSPRERRGAAFGAYHFAVGVAALPASVIFGVLWQRFGSAFALLTGASLALTATLLFLFADIGRPAPLTEALHGTADNPADR